MTEAPDNTDLYTPNPDKEKKAFNSEHPWPPGDDDCHDNLMRALLFDKLLNQDECQNILKAKLDAALSQQYYQQACQLIPGYAQVMKATSQLIGFDPENQWLHDQLAAMLNVVNNKYYNFEVDRVLGSQLITLEAGQSIEWHCDLGQGVFSTRKATMIAFLSPLDSYEGGIIELMASQYASVRQSPGEVFVHPSFYMRRIQTVTKGKLQLLVSWLHGSKHFE